ncbi:DUF447 family protein [Natronomonas moolapensis 8.8.11]|uniref:DUF447 family protein n=1 Tax=Natronomonas moolapensis (strain DSM 18674 / CECT 7526 / JCM 14361 / 8.8.11) TaxID=268739 RepID=M1XLE7_NATM8|nr:DUF447 domain-containing protein [Natronomonas moolapensis]CCQ37584.1 DUF447 family protein [Natronomonas moolapensis 8.8.11]
MRANDADGNSSDAAWPADLRGVTESIVTTLGPNDRWNVAALGLFAGDPVTARTWGRTRTWRNFTERGGGYVQFSADPVDFVDAACSIREEDEPVLESADAWARIGVESIDRGSEGGTQWVDWELTPVESALERETVPTTNRGYYAVVEATVAASRLEVPGYDSDALRARIEYFGDVVERCGGPRERDAFERFLEHTGLDVDRP